MQTYVLYLIYTKKNIKFVFLLISAVLPSPPTVLRVESIGTRSLKFSFDKPIKNGLNVQYDFFWRQDLMDMFIPLDANMELKQVFMIKEVGTESLIRL